MGPAGRRPVRNRFKIRQVPADVSGSSIAADNKGFRMSPVRKHVRIEKDSGLASKRQVVVNCSAEDPDRAGDVVVQKGIDIGSFMDIGGTVLWQHDPNQPIAKAIEMGIVDGKMRALVQFPEPNVSAKADEIYGLIANGVVNAASIGFDPIEFEPLDPKKPFGPQRFLRIELMEFSFVSVPCAPQATIIARSAASKSDAEWKVGASRNLPISAEDTWDADGAGLSIFAHAGFDGASPDTGFPRKGFLAYDAANPKLKTSYNLPFAKVIDGRLTVTRGSIRAAAAALARIDVSDEIRTKARAVIDHYAAKLGVGMTTIKSAAIVAKGLYGVSQLACMLDELGWLANSSAWEAEMEGDGSQVPAMLAEGLRQLADAFVAMSAEEVAEMLATLAPKGDKAARTVALKALFAKSRIAAKAGRRFSQANQEHLDALDKCMKAMDAVCTKMADMHDEAKGHAEEMKGHIDEVGGYLAAMNDKKAAAFDQGAVDGMQKCMGKMASCCQKMAHLHDYLHDHLTDMQDQITEGGSHLKAMQKPDDDVDTETDDDGELAAEVAHRKRQVEVMRLSAPVSIAP